MAGADANRTPVLVAVASVLWAISLLTVGARLLARRIRDTRLWFDDWLILLAAVRSYSDVAWQRLDADEYPQLLLVPSVVSDLLEAHLGAGKHVQTVLKDHPERAKIFLKVKHHFSDIPSTHKTKNSLSLGHLHQ